jgi:hydrogenase expression/formation protein HypD
MKHLSEYRDPEASRALLRAIDGAATRPWVIMEVCGGQTRSIVRHGIDELLPESVELVHGPGCPVCVTPLEAIDRAHAVAEQAGVIFCSFGDMLRVPGSSGDLFERRARGSDVRVVYSPLDAVEIAVKNPEREVVFFAIGFETTAPANAMAVAVARQRKLKNFSVLVSHVLVPPAMTSILQSPHNRVQGFLGPGHVCAIMGTREYAPIAARYRTPVVVTGFEPVDMLRGILQLVQQLERGEARVENGYERSVRAEGNAPAQSLLSEVFEVCDRKWRGIGSIPKSGYRLRYEYRAFDAEHRFELPDRVVNEPRECISGQILRGLKKPHECSAFGTRCTPDRPLGATMVSSEGACSAYFAHGRGDSIPGRKRLPLAVEEVLP